MADVGAPTLIDLFAGAGGMTCGFVSAGFRSILAVEIDRSAAKTCEANFGDHVYTGPIEDFYGFPYADVVIGGPPCQGFSPLGRDGEESSRAQKNALWREYVRAVREARPKAFVIENVPQFLTSQPFEDLLKTLREDPVLSEYVLEFGVLNAADFGVPQKRRRAFVIGSRVGAPKWPSPSHGHESFLQPLVTVRDAIGDLDLEPTDKDLHLRRNPTPKSIERYKAVPEGGNRFDLARNRPDLLPECWRRKKSGTTDVFGRLRWDEPAFTIRTEFFKPEKGRYLHPQAHRPITHREAARLQTFPDSFIFVGTKIEIAKQIGNAVPPKLAQAIGESILKTIMPSSFGNGF